MSWRACGICRKGPTTHRSSSAQRPAVDFRWRPLSVPGPGGEGCQIGVSQHQGHTVPVVLTAGLLQRHLLAIAKTRRGKSSLMLRLVHHLMLAGTTGQGGRGAGH